MSECALELIMGENVLIAGHGLEFMMGSNRIELILSNYIEALCQCTLLERNERWIWGVRRLLVNC